MRPGIAAAVLATTLVFPASAAAQVSGDVQVTVNPAVAGKGSKVSVTATGQATSSGQEAPKTISLLAARGFRTDLAAVAARCTDSQRKAFDCPAGSRIARGSAQGEATFLLQRIPFTATMEAFLMRPFQPGDIAGVAVVVRASGGQRRTGRGRILPVGGTGPFGVEMRFEELPTLTVPPGASARLDRLELTVGADRSVRERRRIKRRKRKKSGARKSAAARKKRRKRRRYRYVRVRHHLINNPRTCAGSWPYQVRVTFPSAPEVVRDGTVACSSR
jgi:hypothetical protein